MIRKDESSLMNSSPKWHFMKCMETSKENLCDDARCLLGKESENYLYTALILALLQKNMNKIKTCFHFANLFFKKE